MKLPLQPFLRAFVSQARARSGESAPQSAADLTEARRLAHQLGGQATLEMAQKAALALVDGNPDRFVGGDPASGVVLEIWDKLQKQAGTRLPAPKICSSSQVDLGAQAGDQVLLEGEALQGELSDPNQLAFVMAHEMGHVIHGDEARCAGMKLAIELFATPAGELSRLHSEANRAIELEADSYAAAVVRHLNCESRPILEKLLKLTAGSTHPDGLARAEVVRGFLPVSDETWTELLQTSETYRKISQAYDRKEAILRLHMIQMQ